MNHSAKSVPVTWSDLVASQSENAARSVAFLELHLPRLERIAGLALTQAYAGCSAVLARSILFGGTSAASAVVRGFHAHLSRVVEELATQNRRAASLAHWTMDFALIAECMGTPRPSGFDSALLQPLIEAREEFSDTEKRSMAFTALALGDTQAALAFLDEDSATYDAPVVRFKFNQFELIRYLAAALDQQRPADWIEPAWVEYVALFPLHIAADAAEWPDLFNFARILANVRGDKISDIADDLHARVQLLARQGQ